MGREQAASLYQALANIVPNIWHVETSLAYHKLARSSNLPLSQPHKPLKILPINHLRLTTRITFQKSLRKPRRLPGLPFKLEGVQLSAGILHVINLLLGRGAPKVRIAEVVRVSIAFHALGKQEVFPQRPGVGPQGERGKVFEDGIANAVVVKINFPAFLDLVPGIAAERRQAEEDEGLLQQVGVSFHGEGISTNELGDFLVAHLAADLERQGRQEFDEQGGLFDLIEGEQVFIHQPGIGEALCFIHHDYVILADEGLLAG